ncbi:MAG: hydrogen gas-evolving membrane-bound hydrogenase subunit E [Chloroflexota bacterium]
MTVPILLTSLLVLGLCSPLLWILRPHRSRFAGWLAALPPAAVTAILVGQINSVLHGEILTETYAWLPEMGLEFALRLDGLSLFFGLIITGIGTCIALYTAYYLEGDKYQGFFYGILYLFMTSMLGLVWADNLLMLFVFWEGTSITSFLLIGYKSKYEDAYNGAKTALAITGFGGLLMLAGMILLGSQAGTYTISEILNAPGLPTVFTDNEFYPAILILILLGACTKSAQFPLHFWLPGSMAAPTPASAYLHSATMVKAGVYLLARLHPALSYSDLWLWSLLTIGGLTMLIAAIIAISKWDLKGLLAYATISQLGILVMTLAFDIEYAYIAVSVGIIAHALYKGPLFMVAGIVDHATGTRDIRRLAGLRKMMPVTALVALLAGLSMAGLPPFFGFVSKEVLLEALFKQLEYTHNNIFWIPIIAVGLAGAFFVAYSLTLLWETFGRSQAPDEHPAHVHHKPAWPLVLPPLLLTLLGTAAPFLFDVGVNDFIGLAATSIAGEEIHPHLAIWHGITSPLIVSLIAIATGVVLFAGRRVVRRILHMSPEALAGANIYVAFMDGLYAFARGITRLIQGGTLASQASVIIVVAVGVLVYALSQLNGFGDFQLDLSEMPQFEEIAIALLAIVAAIVTVQGTTRLNQIISIGVVGVMVTLFFIFFSAPDLALTQLLIETLTLVLLVLVFYKIPPMISEPLALPLRIRNFLVATVAAVFGIGLVLFAGGQPYAPSISDFFSLNSVSQAHGANIVNVILVDFRGFDTMGEITVLVIAALGGFALLRSYRLRPYRQGQPSGQSSGQPSGQSSGQPSVQTTSTKSPPPKSPKTQKQAKKKRSSKGRNKR